MTSGDILTAYAKIKNPQQCTLAELEQAFPASSHSQRVFLLPHIKRRERLPPRTALKHYAMMRAGGYL